MSAVIQTAVLQAQFPGGRLPRALQGIGPAVAQTRPTHQACSPLRNTPPVHRALQPQTHGHATPVPDGFSLPQAGGQSLPGAVREKMEGFFGADFSDVRIHQGTQASSIGALAFTLGSQIHFAPGLYNPQSLHGQRLLAHELAHVVQQRQGRVRNPYGSGVAVVQDPGLEAEAERLGLLAAQSVPAHAQPDRGSAQGGPAQAKLGPPGGPVHAGVQARVQANQVNTGPSQAAHVPPGHHPAVQPKPDFRVVRQHRSPGEENLALYRGGQQVGGADLHLGGQAAKVYNLEVDPAFRGQGGGAALLQALAQAGLSHGAHRITLDSQDNGSGRLTRWYEHHGFQRKGVGERGYAALEAPAQILCRKRD